MTNISMKVVGLYVHMYTLNISHGCWMVVLSMFRTEKFINKTFEDYNICSIDSGARRQEYRAPLCLSATPRPLSYMHSARLSLSFTMRFNWSASGPSMQVQFSPCLLLPWALAHIHGYLTWHVMLLACFLLALIPALFSTEPPY